MNTGCRKGEAIALEWTNVDLKRCVVRIWASEEWQPKDGDNREIPINDALLPWLSRGRAGRWVFPSSRRERDADGDQKAPGRYAFWPQRRFDAVRKAAGLTGGPHKLRHTFASHFLEACPDLFLLGRIMGHSHARVTELYGHLLPDQMTRARTAVAFNAPIGPAELDARLRWGH